MSLNHISILGSSIALLLVGFFAPNEFTRASSPVAPAAAQPSQALQPVTSPDVPKHITFAGKNIDLDPIDMWERLDRELTAMSYTHGNTLLALKRANRYFPVMKPILSQEGLPDYMIYLAVI